MIHSFLMIGQSNMAGRGEIGSVAPISNGDLFVLRNGRWQPMYVPVNADRPFSGVCLAESFADAYQRAHGVQVGLIPCADGGTSMNQWMPGELLFDHACFQARLAQRTSELRGILWHQGEADCEEELYPLYAGKLMKMLAKMREEIGLEDVPVLLGGLGDFLRDCKLGETLKNYPFVNAALKEVAAQCPHTAFVPAEGLTANDDNLHFNAASLREFGRRYFEVLEHM